MRILISAISAESRGFSIFGISQIYLCFIGINSTLDGQDLPITE